VSRKKPPERRQRHGERPRLTVMRAVRPVSRSNDPEPGWLPATRRAFATFWQQEIAQLAQPVDGLAVRRLFALYDGRERAWRLFLKSPYIRGSTGQQVLNPMGAFALQLDARIAPIERAFGITPKARLQLGITFGEARRSLEDLAREAHEDAGEDRDAAHEG